MLTVLKVLTILKGDSEDNMSNMSNMSNVIPKKKDKQNIIWEPLKGGQTKYLSCPAWEVLFHGNRGPGKSLKSLEKILTDHGWVPIKDLSIGDLVYSRDGKLYPVQGVFPQGILEEYKVKFQDGREIICSAEHKWLVNNYRNDLVKTTKQMYGKGEAGPPLFRGEGRQKAYKYRLPISKCISSDDVILPLDPYIVGCMLGDGDTMSATPKISVSDDFIYQYFKKNLPEFEFKHTSNGKEENCYYYTIVDRNRHGGYFPNVPVPEIKQNRNRFRQALVHLGINVGSHDKFIPKEYLDAGNNQRLELLKGLMDTDGYVGKRGDYEYTSVSKQLIDDITYLCRSLGMKCRSVYEDRSDETPSTINGREIKKGGCYRLYINTTEIIVKSPRRIKYLQNKKEHSQQKYTPIVEITKTGLFSDMTCISVASPDHTFITKDFIVTHNTDALLMDYAQEVGKGHGADYRGIILREATTELGDIIAKSKKWFPRIFPGCVFNNQSKTWTFPEGETLWFTYARLPSDYDRFHGQEFQFIGWEELTNHALPDVYLKLMSCNRTSNPNVPLKYRSTTNPSGPGRAWVKERFIDTVPEGVIFKSEIELDYFIDGESIKKKAVVTRAHVKGRLDENTFMDAKYKAQLLANTEGNENLYKAWVLGSWDIVDGGFFNSVWEPKNQLFHSFALSPTWRVFRSFDWGGTKPWGVTYLCETDGTQSPDRAHDESIPFLPKKSMIVIDEIYGWNGKPNQGDGALTPEMCERILANDAKLRMLYGHNPQPGPADLQIWEVKDGMSIAKSMHGLGVRWTRSSKGSGSRVSSLALLRQMLYAAKVKHPENPYLIFFEDAVHHIRTIPITQCDARNPDDINCFVSGTKVSMAEGYKNIEDVVVGDNVKTPLGNRAVLACGASGRSSTYTISFEDGKDLKGTPNHKVFVYDKGLVPLCNLEIGDELCLDQLPTKELCSQNVKADIMNTITLIVTFLKEHSYCIESYGKTILETFQRDIASTTKTTTDLTTQLRILNHYLRQITLDTTSKKDLAMVGICVRDLPSGEEVQKVLNALDLIYRNAEKMYQKENLRAYIVVRLLLQRALQKYTVQETVRKKVGQEKLKNTVSYVENVFGLRDIVPEKPRRVVTSVVGNSDVETVYNLNTEQAHMYYANDCLVSNTDGEEHLIDALRYGVGKKLKSFSRGSVR